MELPSVSYLDVGLAVAVICVLIYGYLEWTFGYWRRKGVPFVPPSSILYGNIKEMFQLKANIGVCMKEYYERFPQSPYVGFYEFQRPALLLRDPDLIKKVLVENFNSFHDNRPHIKESDDYIFGRNPFFIKGKEKWKEARSPITQGLTSNKLKHLPDSVSNVYQEMKGYIKKNRNEDIEAFDLMKKFTCDTAASWTWGIEGGGFSEESQLAKEITQKLSDELAVSTFKMMLMNFNPWFSKHFNFFKIQLLSPEQFHFFVDVTKQSIQRLVDTNNTGSPCLLNSLIQGKIKMGQSTKALGTHSVAKELSGFLAAFYIDSLETTARAMSYMMYSLAIHPEVQRKLRAEIMTFTEEQLNSEDVLKLHYLDMVLSEVLRVYQPATNLGKVCTEKTRLGDIVVEPGTVINIPILGIHNDPKIYPEPEKFDPERFTEENKASRHAYAYLPFGGGPRICPGSRFAINQIKLLMAHIVRDFELLPAEDHVMHPITPNETSILFIPKHPLFMRLRPLNK